MAYKWGERGGGGQCQCNLPPLLIWYKFVKKFSEKSPKRAISPVSALAHLFGTPLLPFDRVIYASGQTVVSDPKLRSQNNWRAVLGGMSGQGVEFDDQMYTSSC